MSNMNKSDGDYFQALAYISSKFLQIISFAVGGYWCLYFIGLVESWVSYNYLGANWVIDLFPSNRYVTYSLWVPVVSLLSVCFSVFILDKNKIQLLSRVLLAILLMVFACYQFGLAFTSIKIDPVMDGVLGVFYAVLVAFVGGFFVGDIVKSLKINEFKFDKYFSIDLICIIGCIFLFAPYLMGGSNAKLIQLDVIKKPNVLLSNQYKEERWKLLDATPSGAVLFIPAPDRKSNIFRVVSYSDVLRVRVVSE